MLDYDEVSDYQPLDLDEEDYIDYIPWCDIIEEECIYYDSDEGCSECGIYKRKYNIAEDV